MVRRLRLTLGYLGTRYAGWEVQSPGKTRGRPTLQGTLEAAITEAVGHPVRVTAAGRTDAGVHADGQVVSFETSSRISCAGLRRLLDRLLPDDIWVVDASEVPVGFDARRSAVRRWYQYAIWRQSCSPSARWRGRSLVDTRELDLASMRRAAHVLPGRRDLAALATRPPAGQSSRRTIFAADWLQPSPSLLLFEIGADAYLKHMVRAIVGSLLWVGSGQWSVEQFVNAVLSGDRKVVGPNAPAVGLTLHRIEY